MIVAESWSRSFLLLLIALGATASGLGATYLARDGENPLRSSEAHTGVIYGVTLLAVWISLRIGKFRGDPYLLPVAGLLGGIGLVMSVRLEPDLTAMRDLSVAFGDRQLWYLVTGMLLIWGIAMLAPNPEILAPYRYTILMAGLGLLAVTALLGTEIQGARLWLSLGPIVIQTTELAKLALIVFLAAYLSENLELVGQELAHHR